MRKEAINTFTEGLVKDLHPLNTSSKVLTDALNATLITYDGNEYILQNDTGNGRVETARLPSGYIPVGVTEYGGIIYVASYNPLTGKSQLGSFPSPERQISTEELGKNFTSNVNINTNNSYIRLDIYDESKKDLYKLNPGDKFIISSLGISKYFSDSYKGILKIHIGVVDKENNITYLEDNSYILDTDNIESNTNWTAFTSKTSGHLTIIIELLSIDTFNVTRNIKLLSANTSASSISESNPEFGISFQGSYSSTSNIKAEQFKFLSNLNSNPIYSETPNLYMELSDLRKSDVLNYTIIPICKYGELSAFTTSGIIDFSAFGTGFCELSEWRYYTDNDYIKISWGLNFDVIKFMKVNKVKFTFHDLMEFGLTPIQFISAGATQNYYVCGAKDNYNGNFSEKIPLINDKTLYGLQKNRMYFTVIDIDFVNTSGEAITPKRYYKMLFTTGVFNKDFVQYKTKDFSSLKYPINIRYDIESKINNTNVTPLPSPNTSKILNQIKESDKVYSGVSTIYNIDGTFKITPYLENTNQFGKLNWKATINEDDINFGLVIKMSDKYTYIVKDSPQYQGASIDNKDALENEMKQEFGGESYRGTVNESKLEIDNNVYTSHLNGYIRRGIIATGISTQSVEVSAMQLTRVVRDTSDFGEYIAASVVGSPNSMITGDTYHAEYNGGLPYQRGHGNEFDYTYTPGDGNLFPSTKSKLSQSLDGACNNERVNSYNSYQLKHPIVYLTIDSEDYKSDDCWFIRGKNLNPNWNVWRKSDGANTKARMDPILVAWKISDYSFSVINLGGVAAWRRDSTNKFEVENCAYEYPQQGRITRLTTTDIIYNLLNNLYTLESNKVTINNTKIPDSNTIVYHGNFNESFEVTYKYGVEVRADKLITYLNNQTEHYFNSVDVKAEITKYLPQYTNIGNSLDNNLTVETNIKTVSDLEYTIKYDIGSTISMDEWYLAYTKISSAETLDSVTVDPAGNIPDSPYLEDTVYVKSGDKYIPFNGSFTYPDGEAMTVKPNFFTIRRTTKSSRPILYINSTSTHTVMNDQGKDGPAFKIDLNATIYPKLKAW